MATLSGIPLNKYYVVVKIPWRVTKVRSVRSACNVAVAEASKKLPSYMDIDVGVTRCEECDAIRKEVMLVGDEALVGLVIGARIVAKDVEGAVRVMKSIVGKHVESTVEVVSVKPLNPR